MRVADKMAYEQVNRSIGKNRTDLSSLQNQAATQKRLTKPSDDPVAASRVLGARTEKRSTEQFIKNLDYAKSFLEFSEESLAELNEVLVRAKELAIGQANDASSNPQTRKSVAAEINQLHAEAVQVGNRKLGERFVFGGFKTTATPFDELGGYHGDDGEMKLHIDKDTFLAMNMPGSIAFMGKGLSANGLNFHSLVQAKDVAELKKQEAEAPEKFDLNEKGQPKTEEEMNASVAQRAPASLRVSENMAPKVSSEENNEYEATKSSDGVNIFHSLKKLEYALMTNDKTGVQESLDRLDDALNQVIVARSALGSRVSAITSTLNSMHSNTVDNKTTISQLEDADAFEVISDINKTESALQATLQTSGKLMQKSLMDFVQL